MSLKTNILHLASFSGNIGDNASHIGLNNILDHFFQEYYITRCEIRKSYKNYSGSDKLEFNENFIRYINEFDLIIIGGGGFLDYWVPNSASGTTLDIEPRLISKIKTPTIIASVGSNPHHKIPSGNILKYSKFLDKCLENPYIKILLRNDGSIESIQRDIISYQYTDHMPEILDHGFFLEDKDLSNSLRLDSPYIAINVAPDQLAMESNSVGIVDQNNYLLELKIIVENLVSQGLRVILIPHIHSDLNLISTLLGHLNTYLARKMVAVAPCLQGDIGARQIFAIYSQASLSVATRLHANICSLTLGTPTIGLAALDRITYLYQSINFEGYCITADKQFSEDLLQLTEKTLKNPEKQITPATATLSKLKTKTLETYNQIFTEFGFR